MSNAHAAKDPVTTEDIAAFFACEIHALAALLIQKGIITAEELLCMGAAVRRQDVTLDDTDPFFLDSDLATHLADAILQTLRRHRLTPDQGKGVLALVWRGMQDGEVGTGEQASSTTLP